MLLSEQEAKKLAERVLSLAKAEEVSVTITGGASANTRFAANSVTTSGLEESIEIDVECRFGQRRGRAEVTETSDEALLRAVRKAEEIARLAPEDKEMTPLLGPQTYSKLDNYSQTTVSADANWRAQAAAASLKPSRAQQLIAAGFVTNSGNFRALANSKGLFAYHRDSRCGFSNTIRSADGTGSGWAAQSANSIDKINATRAAERAIEKAIRSRNPEAIEPGKYTVILEPAAVASLLTFMAFSMGAREAEEGRSFMAKKGGGTRLGEQLFNEAINIYTDPASTLAPGQPFDGEGLPTERLELVKGGRVENLQYSRYWAAKSNRKPTPAVTSLIMDGGTTSVEDMISSTKRGILVTRFWYIRLFDAQTILVTGLTRDGTFLIEDGAIKKSIKNFRFNDSPLSLLANIEALSPSERVAGGEGGGGGTVIAVPAVKARNFTFTSLSDAV